MKHKEIVEFLKKWNEEHPDKKSSYPALFKVKAKFKNFGEDALLSKKGFKDSEYKVKPEFYEYYKNLYLSKSALSIYDCWFETFYYAKEHHKINISNFPSEKTFDRLLKKDISPFVIEQARKKHEKIFAKDLENINTNEYWYTETCQFNFQIKHKHTYFYPLITVVKDIKTSKWLGLFVYHELPNPDHILHAVYYALIKYGNPKELFIKDEKIKSVINRAGQIKIRT